MKKANKMALIGFLSTTMVLGCFSAALCAEDMKSMGGMGMDMSENHGMHSAMAPASDIENAPSCSYCGMDRKKFDFSRMLVEYDDGTSLGTCSIHCTAIDIAAHMDKTPLKIWVGDYNTKNLIDAEKAIWVIGGDKPGVMTKQAKWAFETEVAADEYIKAHGGKLSDFEGVMAATFNDMYSDMKMIREKRKQMHMNQK
jgi:copper chaperone NosL